MILFPFILLAHFAGGRALRLCSALTIVVVGGLVEWIRFGFCRVVIL